MTRPDLRRLAGQLAELPIRGVRELDNARIVARTGIAGPVRPDRLARMGVALARHGPTLGALLAAGGARHPDRPLVADDRGSATYAEMDRRTNAIAATLRAHGLGRGDGVAIMCANHRGFVESLLAASKLGCDILLLNTSFAGPQVRDAIRREHASALIFDQELAQRIGSARRGRVCLVARAEPCERPAARTLDATVAGARSSPPPGPARQGRVTILTSGTTGRPRGAARRGVGSLDVAAALLERVPLRHGQVVSIPAPLFHAWGLAGLLLALALGGTAVLRPRFEPERCLADLARHRAEVLVAVPVMLKRILELPGDVRDAHDTRALSIVLASGSPLEGNLAARWLAAYPGTLYNLYGSTEVAFATLATPADLLAAPGTAGRPMRGAVVRLLDERGHEVAPGEPGRIFVGNHMLIDGYTGGGGKELVGGLMATGDIGRFDAQGRLFVEGRDDDMIVSGGENVFPAEVEEALLAHPAVADAAAVGVDDDAFGQRLRAFVVLRPGHEASPEELRDHVRDRLARYKVPREVVLLDELPRTSTGKVLRRELQAREPDG